MQMHQAAAAGGAGSHCKYASFLGPFLGGSLPGSCAAYHLVKHSPEWVKGVVFGSISLGFFAACTGTVTGSLGTSSVTFQHSRLLPLQTLWPCGFCSALPCLPCFQKHGARFFVELYVVSQGWCLWESGCIRNGENE